MNLEDKQNAMLARQTNTKDSYALSQEPYGVYVMQAGAFVKIGYAKDVSKRKAALQTANPEELVLLKVYAAGNMSDAMVLKHALHTACWPSFVRGEWYRADNELLAVCDNVVKSTVLGRAHGKPRKNVRQNGPTEAKQPTKPIPRQQSRDALQRLQEHWLRLPTAEKIQRLLRDISVCKDSVVRAYKTTQLRALGYQSS